MSGTNNLEALVKQCGSINLIIPVFNEEKILRTQLKPVLDSVPEGFSVTVVENGSTDSTRSILADLQGEHQSLNVLSIPEPSYGNAVRNGLEASSADVLMVDDLDVLDTEFWLLGLALIGSGKAEIVQGSKILAGRNDRRPLVRRMATRVLTMLLKVLLGFNGTDTHGPKIMMRSRVAEILPLCGDEPDLYPSELIIRAQRKGLHIVELPISLEELRETPLALHKRVPRALRDLFRLRNKLGKSSQDS